MQKFMLAASDISFDKPQSNEIYFAVTMRMLTTETNLNGVRLTADFIRDIAEHADEYIGMPLCADVDKLSRGIGIGLTHMYDESAAMFKAPQIGSFVEVHAVEDEHGVSLVGTARINKRNADVTNKIIDMYNKGQLKFSFEIWASELRDEDGVTVVDAANGNRLTAMAIVTTPAIPAAVALGLAADLDIEAYEHKVYNLLQETFRRSEHSWRVIFMTVNYAVAAFDDGTMIRVDYIADGANFVKTDEYEVAFEKVNEVNEEMDQENKPVEVVVETPAVFEAEAEAPVTTEPEAVEAAVENEQTETVETTQPEAVQAEEAQSEAQDDSEAERLKAELAEAKAELERYREAEKAAQMAEKQAAARKYAEREGLNLESDSVKAAIENADYEALAAEVMAKPEENKEIETYGMYAEIKTSPYGNMFDKAN